MEVPRCNECSKNKGQNAVNTPSVLQINSQPEVVLFHRVDIPTTVGDDVTNPPVNGMYRNILVVYEANGHTYLYNSDGIFTRITGSSDFDEINNVPKYGGVPMSSATDIPDVGGMREDIDQLSTDIQNEATARQSADQNIISSISSEVSNRIDADATLNSRILLEISDRSDAVAGVHNEVIAEKNAREDEDATLQSHIDAEALARQVADNDLRNGISGKADLTSLAAVATTGDYDDLSDRPTRVSEFENDSDYQSGNDVHTSIEDAVSPLAESVNAILNGAVSISGISASPTQAALTTAWTTATGISTVINGAKINDSDNQKVWTYYTNTLTWYAASNTAQVTVNQWTDSTAGIVKGSSTDGKIHAESDGTGSVNGWSTLVNTVSSKQDNITAGTTAQYYRGDKTWQTLNKAAVGLGNVDNTTDAAKKTSYTGAVASGNTGFTTGGAVYNALAGKQNTLTAGTNITISGTTISATDTKYNVATTSTNGLISAADKTKLDGIATGASRITMQTTDPGEGATLAANNFIAVY